MPLRKLSLRRRGTKDNQGPVQPADQASSSSSSVPPTSFPNLGGNDSSVHQPPRRTSIEAARAYHRPLPPVTTPVDQEIDFLRSEIKKRSEESDRLIAEIGGLNREYADLRVNLQHHESLEPSQLLGEFRTLNRSIEDLCRDISEYHTKHWQRLRINDPTTEHVQNPQGFCHLLLGADKGPSLYWSAERKFRPLEDAVDYAFRDIINRELVRRIFDPFHPSLREFTATDREFKQTYEGMRRASTQVPCGRWRALSFRYIDVQSSSRVESVDAVADYLEKKLFGPLLSSLRDRNPTPRFLSRSQLSALKTILAAAYEWNHKVKSQFMSLDYHVSLPRDKQFDEWSMQYLGNKKVVDPSRQIISVISLGLESSDAGGPGTQPNRVWQEKITVLTEDYFEQA